MKNYLPTCDQPQNKLMYFGPGGLSDAELLSLVLRTGTKEKSALELAEDVITYTNDNFNDLDSSEVSELIEVYGIGESKACSIVASMELAKRLAKKRLMRTYDRASNTKYVAEILMTELADKKQEHFVVFFLDAKLHILSQSTIHIGTLTNCNVSPRDVMRLAIKRGAIAIICGHNHPSGIAEISVPDAEITERLVEAGKILGIQLMDHVIVGNGNYISCRNEGLIPM